MQYSELETERLQLRRLSERDAKAFHALAIDPHIRQYLLDGEIMSEAWCAEQIAVSDRLFGEGRAGLWLLYQKRALPEEAIGFCGFHVFEELGAEPQLLYALVERCAGKGYATEVARALLRFAAQELGMDRVVSAVDAPNHASIRVLEKMGFVRCGGVPGAFGTTILFERCI